MQRCTTCGRVDDDIGTCGRTIVPCPPPVEVNPKTDVLMSCIPCGITRVLVAPELMKGKQTERVCQGDRTHCQAVVVVSMTQPSGEVASWPELTDRAYGLRPGEFNLLGAGPMPVPAEEPPAEEPPAEEPPAEEPPAEEPPAEEPPAEVAPIEVVKVTRKSSTKK